MTRIRFILISTGLLCVIIGLVLGLRPVYTESGWIHFAFEPTVTCGSALFPDDTAARADDAHRAFGPLTATHAVAAHACHDARDTALVETLTILPAGVVLLVVGCLVGTGLGSRRRARGSG